MHDATNKHEHDSVPHYSVIPSPLSQLPPVQNADRKLRLKTLKLINGRSPNSQLVIAHLLISHYGLGISHSTPRAFLD